MNRGGPGLGDQSSPSARFNRTTADQAFEYGGNYRVLWAGETAWCRGETLLERISMLTPRSQQRTMRSSLHQLGTKTVHHLLFMKK